MIENAICMIIILVIKRMLESNSFDKFPTWASQQNVLGNLTSFDKFPPRLVKNIFMEMEKKVLMNFLPRLVKNMFIVINFRLVKNSAVCVAKRLLGTVLLTTTPTIIQIV